MTRDELVEKVARAMAAVEGWQWNDDRQMLDCAAAGLQNTSRERDTWRNRARAAIEAMREPSEKMIQAALDHPNGDEYHYCSPLNAWQAMIDSALSQPKTGE